MIIYQMILPNKVKTFFCYSILFIFLDGILFVMTSLQEMLTEHNKIHSEYGSIQLLRGGQNGLDTIHFFSGREKYFDSLLCFKLYVICGLFEMQGS